MEWDVDTYSGCPEQRHYETDYSYEHSMTFESSDGGCASDDVCTVPQPCIECVYHVHSCNRASGMGVHTGYSMVDMMSKNSRKFLGKSTGMARVVELINWRDTNRI